MRLALLAVCVVLPASAFLIGCGGHGQSASTSAGATTIEPGPTTAAMHQPPPRTPEQ